VCDFAIFGVIFVTRLDFCPLIVANLVRKRQEELAGVGSGEEESSSEYNIVIDEWIKVVDCDSPS
jgi:hypothetical protein